MNEPMPNLSFVRGRSKSAAPLNVTFSQITTSERENGFLLIETFRKLFNPQNQGHLETGGFSYMSGSVMILHFGESEHYKAMQ